MIGNQGFHVLRKTNHLLAAAVRLVLLVAVLVALGNGLGHVKAGIKAAADAVVIFPSFSGMSFSL